MDRELEIAELQMKYMIELPAGSTGIITACKEGYIHWGEPDPITKENVMAFLEKMRNRSWNFI